jgi:hypothetical protein
MSLLVFLVFSLEKTSLYRFFCEHSIFGFHRVQEIFVLDYCHLNKETADRTGCQITRNKILTICEVEGMQWVFGRPMILY